MVTGLDSMSKNWPPFALGLEGVGHPVSHPLARLPTHARSATLYEW
jgi:hypothetical protein